MERLSNEASKVQIMEAGASVASIENLTPVASRVEAERELDGYLSTFHFDALSLPDQESLLMSLLQALGKTVEGSDVPVDNGNRFLAEAVAKKLTEVIEVHQYFVRNGSVPVSAPVSFQ